MTIDQKSHGNAHGEISPVSPIFNFAFLIFNSKRARQAQRDAAFESRISSKTQTSFDRSTVFQSRVTATALQDAIASVARRRGTGSEHR